MAHEANRNGILLGDVLISWISQTASLAAEKHSGHERVLTVNMDQIHFKSPIRLGDLVILTSSVDYVGRSSMEVGVRVEVENLLTAETTFVASALLTVLALGRHSIPLEVPRLLPKSSEELGRYQSAQTRVKTRGQIHNWIQDRFPVALWRRTG